MRAPDDHPMKKPASVPAAPTRLYNNPVPIKKFQRFHGLTPDGIVGPKTRRKMRQTNTTLYDRGLGVMTNTHPKTGVRRAIRGHDESH